MERPWSLTGRDEELRAIAAALRPGAAGVHVAGPPGVGKTRLVREALTRGPARQRRVVWAHGSTAARQYPLGAFAGVVAERVSVEPQGPAHAVADTIQRLVEPGPVVLVVDDAHLLDELSAIVVHRVVVQRLAPVIATVRTGEPAPDPVTALWKDDHLPRMDLGPLDLGATATLLARVLGGPVESVSARRLWALTEGSPLYLRHLVAGELDAGRLAPSAGIWRWTDQPTISAGLAALLQHQIGALPPAVRDVVDILALAEPVAAPALTRLTAANAVEGAESRGLVRADAVRGTLVLRLAHPLYGEVRRAVMGRLRARRLRGLVAVTLVEPADLIPRAVLVLDSDLDPDPPLFLRAAEAALRLHDLPLAERLARAAATTGDRAALLLHASALSWLSRGEEAEAILRVLADGALDPATRSMAHLYRAGNLFFTLARPGDARAALAAAHHAGGAPVHTAAMSAALSVGLDDIREVLDHASTLLDADHPDELSRLLAASAVSGAAAVTGCADLLAGAAALGGLTSDHVPTAIPGFGLADFQILGHRLAGDLGAADEVARHMQVASADLPGPARLMGQVLAGHAALARGLVREALEQLREAWAGLAPTGHEFRYRARTLLAAALSLSGRAQEAGLLLDGVTTDQHPAYRLYAPDDLLARAWGAAADGAPTEGARLAAAAAHLARRQQSPAYEVLAWQTWVQLAPAPQTPARLAELAASSHRAECALTHALALAERDADGLLAASGAWARLGDLIAAGDAAAQAATMHRRAGRPGAALTAAAEAGRLAQRSGAHTPALAAATRPLPLTAREREIATLAAHGLSNRAIATRLTVSVRTVEGHLYRASHKLGVSDRSELGTILASGAPGLEVPARHSPI
ncbi:helix-turn-helix transcriptional regulator [Puerhibacterium puerhi]|uniref:helix-turn-helix transcriptional regulator n=1 Tax=Puerhibacterium puerhi TaxID=2692623 RepID=UPI001358D607|nr:LuxR family transcriptional regulator [Puerhibacterium puerhi]